MDGGASRFGDTHGGPRAKKDAGKTHALRRGRSRIVVCVNPGKIFDMKNTHIATAAALAAAAVAALSPAWAQDRVYRCGNEYINSAEQAKERGCKLVETPITVLPSAPPSSAPSAPPAAQNNGNANARAAREAELRKAEATLADLKKEYNDGMPQRTALELRNPQGYIERTEDLKNRVARAEADVENIKRELAGTR